jgi:hypothetical protein
MELMFHYKYQIVKCTNPKIFIMKNDLINFKFYAAVQKLIICLTLSLYFISGPLQAQDDTKSFAFSPGFGIGIGIFNPKGVNEYIKDDLTDFITINAQIYMYEEVHFFLNFKFKWFDVTGLAEYALGPKIVIGGNGNYFFNRLSPGALANLFIPIGLSGKNALFIGGGAQYHIMSFEDYKANTIGYRVQLGFDLQFGHANIQPTLAFNIANAKNVLSSSQENRDLNYTGGQIGVNISFHKPVTHH